MYVKEHKGTKKIMMYQKGSNYKYQTEINSKKKMANEHILIVGTQGSGKSVLTERIAYEYYKAGYVIIYFTGKKGGYYDPCYCMFEPKDKEHINSLNITGIKPEKIPCKIYRPFNFKANYKKIPETIFFTFPIKSIQEDSLSIITTQTKDSQTVRSGLDVIKKLNKNASIHDFILELRENLNLDKEIKQKIEFNEDNAYMPDIKQSSGTKETLTSVISGLKSFLNPYYFLMPESHKLNLNILDVVNDKKNYHVLNLEEIEDDKVVYLVINLFLNEIKKAIIEHKTKYPVLLIAEEVRHLFPKDNPTIASEILAQNIKQTFSTLRNVGKGGVAGVLTTQNSADISKSIADTPNEELHAMLHPREKKSLKKNFDYSVGDLQRLNSLSVGNIIWRRYFEKYK